ncbi:hypothetical protein [Halobacteriovorax sp.]|uniref:hypothetical protein n=1 Tax=Halobacteriovorax sp. TaxID=2020862 RepID=UPI0035653DDF
MKHILLLAFIFTSRISMADSASGKVNMRVEGHVNIIEEIKVNREVTIKTNRIVVSPNKMLMIQTPQGTITKSSGRSGEVKSQNNFHIDIFF